ncbi:hypothetical protein [Dyella sp. Tek66A03]
MKLRWTVIFWGALRLAAIVTVSVILGGAAYMLLIKILLGVHLHALE